MTLREQINQWAEDNDLDLVLFDPADQFDDAILGLVHGAGQEPAVVYDQAKVVAAMQGAMNINGHEAGEDAVLDWFSSNTLGAHLGKATPRFLIRPWEGESDVDET